MLAVAEEWPEKAKRDTVPRGIVADGPPYGSEVPHMTTPTRRHTPPGSRRDEGINIKLTVAAAALALTLVLQIIAAVWLASGVKATLESSTQELTRRMDNVEGLGRQIEQNLNAVTGDLRERIARLETFHRER